MNIKVLGLAILSAATALLSPAVSAQEFGRVISSTPVVSQLPAVRQFCSVDAYRNQVCTNQTVMEQRTTGYTVVYEFQGKTYSMYTVQLPGSYIELTAAAVPPSGYNQNSYDTSQAYSNYNGAVVSSGYVGPAVAIVPPRIVIQPNYRPPVYSHAPVVVIRPPHFGHHGHHANHGGYRGHDVHQNRHHGHHGHDRHHGGHRGGHRGW
jgi:hypothetical protein